MSAAHQALLARCTFPPGEGPIVCAVSGGADSLALLALACATGREVTAIHVDHGLRPGGAAEAALVERAARQCGADFRAERVDVAPGVNLEARARAARYAVLPPGVCTGHTLDDQAETMLLALLRGSGWHGLSGMAPGPTHPILALRRRETAALCASLGLEPVDDPSNRDPAHRRNRVRHELMPLLADIADRDPVPVLARQAELFREGAAVLDELARELDPTDARQLVGAPTIVARTAVRHWLRDGTGAEHPVDLAAVDRVLAVARGEIRATELAGGWRVARTEQVLRIEPPAR